MQHHQILGMLAGYNYRLVVEREGSEAYRVIIPGLERYVTVPVTWEQHNSRVHQGYGRDTL